MYEAVRNFPRQFLVGWGLTSDLGDSPELSDPVTRILFCGMGGSALVADLANDYLEKTRQIFIVNGYALPKSIGSGDLVVCSSYSGNTEETLAVFADSLFRKVRVLVLAHGGELLKQAKAKALSALEIPACIQPRCAIGYFFGALLGIFERIGWVPSGGKEQLSQLTRFLECERDSQEKKGKELVLQLVDRVPMIYGPSELAGTCRVIKIKFNENTKIPCFWNVFPELNHNEMVGFTNKLMPATFIFLRSKFMHARMNRRMDVMKDLFKDQYPTLEMKLEGDTLLQEMFDGLAVADYASYYLAKNYGIDPAAVTLVEDFKRQLG